MSYCVMPFVLACFKRYAQGGVGGGGGGGNIKHNMFGLKGMCEQRTDRLEQATVILMEG